MTTTIADLVVKIGADITGFKAKVKELEGEYSNVVKAGEKLQSVGRTMSTYITAPLVAAGAAAIKMAADVDKGISEVVTLFDITGDEATVMTDKLKKGVAGVSNEVGIAQDVITKGLYNAISAGVPQDNIFDFMTVAAKASIAGVTDINTAVDGITTSINAYGLSAEDAMKVSDSMFAAVQGGKTTFEELSKAIFNVAPKATALGVSMEEVNAALATLTASGVPTSVATTNMRAALDELGRASTATSKTFKELSGKSFPDFIQAGGTLQGALKIMQTEAERTGLRISDMFGSAEAGQAVTLLATTNAKKFADELKRQAEAAGSTEKAFELMAQTTSQQFQITLTLLQNIAISIGSKLLPAFNSFLGVVQDVLNWFNSLSDTWQNAILIVVGIVAAIGPLLTVFGTLATMLPVIGAGFTLLTGPIGLAIAAIAGIVAAAALIYANWDGIVDWFEDLWYRVKMIHLQAAENIINALDKIFGAIPGVSALFIKLKNDIQNAIDSTEVARRAELVERQMKKVADETAKTGTAFDNMGIKSSKAGDVAEKAAEKATDAQELHRKKIEAVNEAIDDISKAYIKSMSSFDREIEIGIRVGDDEGRRLKHEIDALTRALTQAAANVDIDLNSKPILELRQRLQEAKAELMGLKMAADASKISIRSMTGEIDDAKASLSLMSKISGEAISADTFRKAKDAVADYGFKINDATSKFGKFNGIVSAISGPLQMLSDKSMSAADKISELAKTGIAMIPGIGTALVGVLDIMDSFGIGLNSFVKNIIDSFKKVKPADSAAEWFRDVERIIRQLTAKGLDAGQILADLKIIFPDISEKTLKALVDGTSEAFADYNRWLATQNYAGYLKKNRSLLSDMLIEALTSGLSEQAAMEKVIGDLFKKTSKEIEDLFGISVKTQKWAGYDFMRRIYGDEMEIMLTHMKRFGVEFNKSWDDIVDPAEQAAIEIANAFKKISETLEKNIDTINEKLKAGIITQEMADTQILKEYERAISDMFDAGMKADDPRLVAMIDAWKALGGGAKGAAEDTDEAVDDMAKAIKKQEEVYAATLARIAKLEADNAAMIQLGVKTQSDAQKELIREYERSIIDLVNAGLKSDDPRLIAMVEAWKKLGGGVKDAAEDTDESTDAMIAAIKKQEEAYAASVARIAKIEADNAAMIKLGIITQSEAQRELLREYERSIKNLIDAGLKPDDPRLVAMVEAWKLLGGGVKNAAEDTDEATEEMIAALKKQEEAYAASIARIAKLEADNAALIALGVKSQADAQKELMRAYAKAIEDLVDAGLKPDDPRLIAMVNAWKSLGGTVEDATDKIKETVSEQEKAAAKLQKVYEDMAVEVERQFELIRSSFESGSTDSLTALQQEALLLRDTIETLLKEGMNPDDARLQGWQSRLNEINQDLKDLGKSTYEVIEPTDKVGLAWRNAGDSLTQTLDHIEKRNLAGLFNSQTDMLREQANAYKRAIEEFLKAGDPDDPRIQGWLESLRLINERLGETGDKAIDLRDKFEIAADEIRKKLDEKLGNIEYDMKFNFEGSDKDLDVQIEKTKAKMKALNDAIVAAGQAGFDKQDEFVKDLIATYQGLFEKLNELEWQKTQEDVGEMFDVTAKKLAELEVKYKLFGDTQDYLAEKMKYLKDTINRMIQEGIDPEDERLLELSRQYKEAAEAAERYAESQRQIREAIKEAIGMGPDQNERNTLLMKLGEAALELWGRVDSLVRRTSDDAVIWLSGWSSSVLNVFKKALDDSRTFRDQVISQQTSAFSGQLHLINTAWGLATEHYDNFVKHVKDDLRTTLSAIHNTGIGFGSGITTGFGALSEGIADIREILESAVAGFSELALQEFNKTKTFAQSLADAMEAAFKVALERIRQSLGELSTVTVTITDTNAGEGAQVAGSPLAMFNGALTGPSMDAMQPMISITDANKQVIYVNLDGRTLAESAFYNLPDVVRMHTGGLK